MTSGLSSLRSLKSDPSAKGRFRSRKRCLTSGRSAGGTRSNTTTSRSPRVSSARTRGSPLQPMTTNLSRLAPVSATFGKRTTRPPDPFRRGRAAFTSAFPPRRDLTLPSGGLARARLRRRFRLQRIELGLKLFEAPLQLRDVLPGRHAHGLQALGHALVALFLDGGAFLQNLDEGRVRHQVVRDVGEEPLAAGLELVEE